MGISNKSKNNQNNGAFKRFFGANVLFVFLRYNWVYSCATYTNYGKYSYFRKAYCLFIVVYLIIINHI